MEETWKSGAGYPNRYDRQCKECKQKIPIGGQDYFYRNVDGIWESMCRSCMNKIPKAPENVPPKDDYRDEFIDQMMILNETLAGILKALNRPKDVG